MPSIKTSKQEGKIPKARAREVGGCDCGYYGDSMLPCQTGRGLEEGQAAETQAAKSTLKREVFVHAGVGEMWQFSNTD